MIISRNTYTTDSILSCVSKACMYMGLHDKGAYYASIIVSNVPIIIYAQNFASITVQGYNYCCSANNYYSSRGSCNAWQS